MASTHTHTEATQEDKHANAHTGHDAGHTKRDDSKENSKGNSKDTNEDDSHNAETRSNSDFDNANRSDNLQDSPTMSRLLDALNEGMDIGHYGQFTFVAVARHFLSEDEIVELLVKQPGMNEERARALYIQIKEHDYNPPKRDKIIEQQAHQEFQIIEDAHDPDAGNLYRELRFPDGLYEHINHYYEDKAASETDSGN